MIFIVMKLLGSSTITNYPCAFISHSQNSFSFPSLIKVRLYPSKSSRDTNGSHNFVYQEVQDLNLCFLLFLLYYYYFNLTKYFVPLFQIKKKKKKKKNQRPCWPNLLFRPILVEIRKAVSQSYRIYQKKKNHVGRTYNRVQVAPRVLVVSDTSMATI